MLWLTTGLTIISLCSIGFLGQEVAQTMVALNIDLGAVATYADLREAIESLLPRNGWRRLSSTGQQKYLLGLSC